MRRHTRISTLTRIGRWTVPAVAAALALTGTALAAEVYWNNPGSMRVGEQEALELVFVDTEPAGRVAPPDVNGLEIFGSSTHSSSISVINAQRSSRYTLIYPTRPQREGKIEIPPFQVKTTAGMQTVPPITIDVRAAAQPSTSGTSRVNDAVQAQLIPSKTKPFAGELFDVDVIVGLAPGRRGKLVGAPTWKTPGIVAEPWSDGDPVSVRGGAGMRFRTRAFAPQSGTFDVSPVQQDVQIESRERERDPFFSEPFAMNSFFSDAFSFDSFFSRPRTTDVTVTSNPAHLEVQPLPQPAPRGFTGAVGTFALESKMVPTKPKAGEPVTWTLTLRGTGNWPTGVTLPARAIPTNIRTIQPKQRKTFADDDLFTGAVSEDLVLVPTKAGQYPLEPVRFVYFDPHTQQYETAIVRPPALTVAPSAFAGQRGPVPAIAGGAPQAAGAAPRPATSNDAGHAEATRLPHDPLVPVRWTLPALAPLRSRVVWQLVAVPVVLLAGYWLSLAWRRTRATDPGRSRREAYTALRRAIERARHAANTEQRRHALLTWQRATATVLGLDLAAPTATALRQQTARTGSLQEYERLVELWQEAEHALYGKDGVLSDNWCERAVVVGTRMRRPRINPLRVFLPNNLLPRLAMACLPLVLLALPAHATPVEDYTAGHLAAAAKQWRAQMQAHPLDWVTRYNLGLSAAQAGDHGRAFAETAAAFVEQPRNESVRWNLTAFAAQLPGADPALVNLATHNGAARLARTASPAEWQVLLIASAAVMCLGAGLWVGRRYSAAASGRRWPARSLLIAGALAGLTAVVALRQYGPLAAPEAALVAAPTVLRSIPTQAESGQRQKPLAAGAGVVIEQHFLGWAKVARANGETGWLRANDLVPVYAAPRA